MTDPDRCDKNCPFLELVKAGPGDEPFEPIWICELYHVMLGEMNGDDLPDQYWQCLMERL